MDKQQHALRLAEWLENEPGYDWDKNYCLTVAELRRLHQVNQELVEALEDILSARSRGFEIDYVEGYAETTLRRFHQTPAKYQCSSHPYAPHGFDRNASHSADRYVCECESWSPKHKEQE